MPRVANIQREQNESVRLGDTSRMAVYDRSELYSFWLF